MKPLPLSPDRTLIVAELSGNHGGDKARAVELIRAVAAAGADAVKLQTYRPDTLTIRCEREEFIVRGGLWNGRTLWDLYAEAHTPWEWHADLMRAATEVGLPVFSTPFDATAVDFLEGLGVPAHKIASFECTDLELVAKVASTKKPIIMSTGMATLAEIDASVRKIREVWGAANPGLALLKCVSAYPAAPEDMNLSSIPVLGQAFGAIPGLSDHTLGTGVAVASVVLGARVIEKHVTLRRADGGPDAAFSLEPQELQRLVTDVRQVEAALGKPSFGVSEAERGSLTFRRSIFVVEDVAAGERLTRDNLRVIRPGYGLAPAMLPWVLGRPAARALVRGTPLTLDALGVEGPS